MWGVPWAAAGHRAAPRRLGRPKGWLFRKLIEPYLG